ncbi:nitrate- and nitrite sensing domain-containing protein [Paraglaciecola aquimarina]|uniref:Nitrate- and nitrite sensing domain-containing protein n=1 Tax=Paraglaciecola algarum TaxID=3050085 RepID=A0ABS9D7F4_9ALTE|nr:nitrate- and nitrite sensing domain-containing protein [Paraglaciecola sp. G1-23]MCF2948315.1 nitrate- and nitrite sensing domain-containing protein [Paraglaciecola sp. G1-23]
MKETLLGAAIIATISVVTIIYITWKRKQHWLNQQAAVEQVFKVKKIIAMTQKHRGMCASFLQGKTETQSELTQIVQTIHPIIEQLNTQKLIKQQDRWVGYQDHWGRLSKQATKLTLEESFQQHTNLITNLLYLFEDIAEQQNISSTFFADANSSKTLWQTLPFAAEFIGQSRAIGVAIAAKGTSTQVDKVKLGYLETKINQLSQTVFKHFADKRFSHPEHNQILKIAQESCQYFLALLHTELLEVNKVTIAPETYFEAASKAMNGINRLLDNELQALKQQVKKSY